MYVLCSGERLTKATVRDRPHAALTVVAVECYARAVQLLGLFIQLLGQ